MKPKLPRFARNFLLTHLDRWEKQKAIRQLRAIGGHVQQRSFSFSFRRSVFGKVKRIHFERSLPCEIKRIEQLLSIINPQLNRKQRRHLARKHRYLSQSGLTI